MHTITVDDESLAVSAMQRTLARVDPDGEHKGFYRVKDFLEYIDKHDDIDIAFIDVEMTGRDGISLTREVKRIAPNMNIVIYSGHRQYRADAMDEHVSSFIVKPVDEEKLRVALDNLGNTAQRLCVRYAVRIFVRLPKFTAGILTYFKVNLGDMTEILQVDCTQSRQAVFVRCCL